MKKLLLIFIKGKKLAGDSVSETFICEKALHIYDDLMKKSASTSGGESDDSFTFKASGVGLKNSHSKLAFIILLGMGRQPVRTKQQLKNTLPHSMSMSRLKSLFPNRSSNCDKTGLFWKKMPTNTYITREEKKMLGHKPMKDRLMLPMLVRIVR